ncbi:hypothetical protein [Persicirhabdus sediminis]|uniref:Transcription elongation factor GreAB n=1 Tax=Persicirhabdus sediminis TaxID=454144 RepID=A0A8J7MBE3_9BACT|nr:hypothetical protein [Persicirhabdus sediminis]MBK1789891.1 hypothetical protein [Persicirhabdus sediminis]
MEKQDIVKQLIDQLEEKLMVMAQAAQETHEASTGSENAAEGKYDTRGLEASYLANAQAEQVKVMQSQLDSLKSVTLEKFELGEPIDIGALVELDREEELEYFLLLPSAGGLTLPFRDSTLTTIAPESALFQQLFHRGLGDMIEPGEMLILGIS